MSDKPSDATTSDVRPEGDVSDEKVEASDQNGRDGMPSPQQEEAAIKKKYGGIMPRKTPLISKDHERAYFDSADWALGKQGRNPQKPKGPLEALRPKLQVSQLSFSLLNNKLVRVDFLVYLLRTKRSSIRLLRMSIHQLRMQARTRIRLKARTTNEYNGRLQFLSTIFCLKQ